jgi:hypothetical protein
VDATRKRQGRFPIRLLPLHHPVHILCVGYLDESPTSTGPPLVGGFPARSCMIGSPNASYMFLFSEMMSRFSYSLRELAVEMSGPKHHA